MSDTCGNGAARDKMKDLSYLTLSDRRDCTAVSQHGHHLSVFKNGAVKGSPEQCVVVIVVILMGAPHGLVG